MSNLSQVDKTHVPYHPNYITFPLRCPICIKIQKISKVFKSPYALLYHLTNTHNSEDELLADVTANEVHQIISTLVKAIQLKMLL